MMFCECRMRSIEVDYSAVTFIFLVIDLATFNSLDYKPVFINSIKKLAHPHI